MGAGDFYFSRYGINGNSWQVSTKKTAGDDLAEPKGGLNSVPAALFALSAFMLAFTFGMSGSWYENARNLTVEDANNISTAILRSNLYSDSVRNGFCVDFRNYLEARIAYFENPRDINLVMKAKADAAKAAAGLWTTAIQQSKLPNMLIPSNNMIPALNDMFDIAVTKEVVLLARVPDLIVYMSFALLYSMVIYTTLDLGSPARGLIKSNLGEQAIEELRKIF